MKKHSDNATEHESEKDSFYDEWERKLHFWNSLEGEELALCMINQGYEGVVFIHLTMIYGTGFTAIKIINELKDNYIKKDGGKE